MIHPQILFNGEIRKATEASLYPGQLGLLAGWGVFSTLRAVDGYVFAWERHWARMSRDAKLMNVPMPPEPGRLERDIMRLIETNASATSGNCTVRVVIVRNSGGLWDGPSGGAASAVVVLTAKSAAWGESVALGIQPNSRFAAGDFVSAKTMAWGWNLRWYERAHEDGFDEVVLLNERGQVAECTSANIFAAFGNEVRTPPITDGCLPGITREVLIEAIRVPGLKVRERSLVMDDLYAADEVCITSSTRGLLAVREIAGRALVRRRDAQERLSAAFESFVLEDIARRRESPAAVVHP